MTPGAVRQALGAHSLKSKEEGIAGPRRLDAARMTLEELVEELNYTRMAVRSTSEAKPLVKETDKLYEDAAAVLAEERKLVEARLEAEVEAAVGNRGLDIGVARLRVAVNQHTGSSAPRRAAARASPASCRSPMRRRWCAGNRPCYPHKVITVGPAQPDNDFFFAVVYRPFEACRFTEFRRSRSLSARWCVDPALTLSQCVRGSRPGSFLCEVASSI